MPKLPASLRIAALAAAVLTSLTLADLSHAAGTGANGSKQYRQAVRSQRAQMQRVETLLRVHSCAARRSEACATLRASFRNMERNLRSLNRQLARISRAERSRSAAARGKRERAGSTAKRNRSAAGKWRTNPRSPSLASVAEPRGNLFRRAGTYRTMCVRMCDGFAFPISLSTRARQFGADSLACQARCPGASLRLYAAPSDEEGVDAARDVESGAAYGDLPTAYRYKRVFDSQCACGSGRAKGLDYGQPVAAARKPKREAAATRPARDVRIVGKDYFAAR